MWKIVEKENRAPWITRWEQRGGYDVAEYDDGKIKVCVDGHVIQEFETFEAAKKSVEERLAR